MITLRFAWAFAELANETNRAINSAIRGRGLKCISLGSSFEIVRARWHAARLLFGTCDWFCTGRWLRHQIDKHFVEFSQIQFLWHIDEIFAKPRLRSRHPDECIAIARAVRVVHVHVKLSLLGDDARIEPSGSGEFVPAIFFVGIFRDILRRRILRFCDLGDHRFVHARLDGDVDGGDRDFVPAGSGERHVDGLGVPPEIKFASIRGGPWIRSGRGDRTAHDDEFLGELWYRWIETDRLRDIGERPAGVYRYLVRIFVKHANDEMRGVLFDGLRGGIAFFQVGNFIGTVKGATLPVADRSFVPGSLVADFAVEALPALDQLHAIDQRIDGAGNDGNVGSADQLEHSQRVRHLFVAPHIAADHRDAEDFNFGRLQEDEDRLLVGSGGAARVLINDHFALCLR